MIQGSIGNVLLGSAFATAQSAAAAAGGAGMAVVAGATQVCGGIITAIGVGLACMEELRHSSRNWPS